MKPGKPDYATIFFVLFATAIGGYLRTSQVIDLPLPLNDGGLFYAMTQDLQANHFRLPAVTSFNNANIPFTYPPLAFYLYGLVSALTDWPLLDLFRLLPPVVATLSIPAFYLLAKELFKDKAKPAVATYFFAVLPAGYSMLIMGGGVTRSLGFLFFLLTLTFVYRMFTSGQRKNLLLAILFGGLTCLSHPESAVRAAASAVLLFLFFGRNRRGAIHALLVAGGVILLTAPWWGTVTAEHGIEPFLAASRTGGHSVVAILAYFLALLKGMLTEDIFLTFIGSLALLGVFLQCAKKEFFLSLWLVLALLIEPRNSAVYLAPVVAMLASVGAVELLFKALRSVDGSVHNRSDQIPWAEEMLAGWMNKVVFAYLLGFSIISSYTSVFELSRALSATREDLQAVKWVNANVPAGQPFLFIKATSIPEWFPVLTQANSVALVQGREWQNEDFSTLLDISNHLELCAEQDKACLDEWQQESGLNYRYVYLGKWRVQTKDGVKVSSWPLKESLLDSGLYELVYESETREILRLKE